MRLSEIEDGTLNIPGIPDFYDPIEVGTVNNYRVIYDGGDTHRLKMGLVDIGLDQIVSFCVFTQEDAGFRYLTEIYTDPKFAGKKLASKLLTYVVCEQFGVYVPADSIVSISGRGLIKSVFDSNRVEVSTTSDFVKTLSKKELHDILNDNAADVDKTALYIRKK